MQNKHLPYSLEDCAIRPSATTYLKSIERKTQNCKYGSFLFHTTSAIKTSNYKRQSYTLEERQIALTFASIIYHSFFIWKLIILIFSTLIKRSWNLYNAWSITLRANLSPNSFDLMILLSIYAKIESMNDQVFVLPLQMEHRTAGIQLTNTHNTVLCNYKRY